MIGEFERFHGVVLRDLIVRAKFELRFRVLDDAGRVNSFLLDGRVAVHIKHSSKRLAPWLFTFSDDNHDEIERLPSGGRSLWLALVCGIDGVLVLSHTEYRSLTDNPGQASRFIRVDRDRHTQYRVFGNSGLLRSAKPRGVTAIVADLRGEAETP